MLRYRSPHTLWARHTLLSVADSQVCKTKLHCCTVSYEEENVIVYQNLFTQVSLLATSFNLVAYPDTLLQWTASIRRLHAFLPIPKLSRDFFCQCLCCYFWHYLNFSCWLPVAMSFLFLSVPLWIWVMLILLKRILTSLCHLVLNYLLLGTSNNLVIWGDEWERGERSCIGQWL